MTRTRKWSIANDRPRDCGASGRETALGPRRFRSLRPNSGKFDQIRPLNVSKIVFMNQTMCGSAESWLPGRMPPESSAVTLRKRMLRPVQAIPAYSRLFPLQFYVAIEKAVIRNGPLSLWRLVAETRAEQSETPIGAMGANQKPETRNLARSPCGHFSPLRNKSARIPRRQPSEIPAAKTFHFASAWRAGKTSLL